MPQLRRCRKHISQVQHLQTQPDLTAQPPSRGKPV